MPRQWRGSVRSHKGWLLLYVKDEAGKWVERSTSLPDTPENRRKAERLLADLRERFRAREDATGAPGPTTVDAWAANWGAKRENRDRANDAARLRLHVLPYLGPMLLAEVKPRHLDDLAQRWKRDGLAPRTRRNVYSVVKAMFRDAAIAGLIEQRDDPCILTHRQLGKIKDAPGFVRREHVYTRDELEALISDLRIPQDRRVWYGLLGVGILRTGEAAGLRWGKITPAEPLGCMTVDRSYDGPTKTEDERLMPIHPALAALLAEWKLGGWAREFGHPPGPDDLVCPVTHEPPRKGPRRTPGSMRDKNWPLKRLKLDLETLGFRDRRAHDLRRTGISLARSAGARADLLERGTHHAPGEVMDLYTTPEWEALCREVAKLPARIIRPGAGSSGSGAGVDRC